MSTTINKNNGMFMKKYLLAFAITSGLLPTAAYSMEAGATLAEKENGGREHVTHVLSRLRKNPSNVEGDELDALGFEGLKKIRGAAKQSGSQSWRKNVLPKVRNAKLHLLEKLGIQTASLKVSLSVDDPKILERTVLGSFNTEYKRLRKSRPAHPGEVQQLVIQHMGTLASMLPEESDLSREIKHLAEQFQKEDFAHVSHQMGALEAITQELLHNLETQKRQEELALLNTLGAAAGEKLLAAAIRVKKERDSATQEKTAETKNLETANASLGEVRAEVSRLGNAKSALEKEQDDKKQILQKLRVSLALSNDDTDFAAAIERLRQSNDTEIAEVRKNLVAANAAKTAQKEKATRQLAELAALQQKKNTADIELSRQRESGTATTAEVTRLLSRVEELGTAHQAKVTELATATAKNETANASLEEVHAEVSRLKRSNGIDIAEALRNLKAANAEKGAKDEAIARHLRELTTLRQAKEAADIELSRQRESGTATTAEVTRLLSRVEELGTAHQAKATELATATANLETANASLGEARGNIATLHDQMGELGTLYTTKASEVSTVQDSLTTANADLEAARGEISRLGDTQGTLEQERDTLTAKKDQNERLLQAKDGELTNLRSQLETEKSRLQQELEERMAAATEEEMVSVGTSCDDLGKRAYAQLKKECEQTRAELQRITHEKNTLEAQEVNPGLDENGQLERIRTLEDANRRYAELVQRAGDQIVRLRTLNEAFQKELGATRFEEIKRKTATAQKEAQEALAKGLAQRGERVQDSDEEEDDDSDFA